MSENAAGGQLEKLPATSPLPEPPDLDEMNRWLVHAYRTTWDSTAA